MAHLAQGDCLAARAALRIAVSLGDHLPETLLNLALAEDRAGNPRRGQVLMTELCHRLPGWDEPALRLAESLRRDGQATAAKAAYQDALDRNPQRADALIGFAALLMESGVSHDDNAPGRHARAQMLLLQCCALAPARADAWHALGIALFLTGEPGKAEAAFSCAGAVAERHSHCHSTRRGQHRRRVGCRRAGAA